MNQRISHLNVGLEMNESEIKQQPQKQTWSNEWSDLYL